MKNCRESQQVSLILKGAFKRTLMAFCNFHYQTDGNHRERVLGMWRMCRSLCGSAEKPEKSRQGSWSIQRFLIDFGKQLQLQLPSTAMGKQSTKYIFFFKMENSIRIGLESNRKPKNWNWIPKLKFSCDWSMRFERNRHVEQQKLERNSQFWHLINRNLCVKLGLDLN